MKAKIIKLVVLITLCVGFFSCTSDINGLQPEISGSGLSSSDEDNMVSIKIQCATTGAVDPNIVSFALPNLVHATCFEILPHDNYGGIPGAFSPHIWVIALQMTKGTDVTKLAPIITLAPGATITPKSGTVHDFSVQTGWELLASDGSSHHYISSAFAIGDELP